MGRPGTDGSRSDAVTRPSELTDPLGVRFTVPVNENSPVVLADPLTATATGPRWKLPPPLTDSGRVRSNVVPGIRIDGGPPVISRIDSVMATWNRPWAGLTDSEVDGIWRRMPGRARTAGSRPC